MQWTTPVSKLLPDDFALEDPEYTRNVTIEDILSHRTGLPTHDASYFGIRAKNPDNAKSITRNIRNLPLSKPLRTTFQYCNIMFTAATHLVETISGAKYPDFLRKRLWDPLGMADTYHDLPGINNEPAKERIATPYRWDEEAGKHVAIPVYPQPEGQGAGSIFTSPKEYAKWIRALINQDPVLSETTHKDLITPRTIVLEDDGIPFYSTALYALGLEVQSYRGRKIIMHTGGVPGFTTFINYIPELKWGLVVMSNSADAYHPIQILYHVLMDDVLGVPEKERIDWEKFFSERQEENKAKGREKEKNDPKFQVPGNPEPLCVSLESLAGTYFNAGYKGLVLEMKNAKLVADCDDRCYPFNLTFIHLSGKNLVAEWYDKLDAETHKMKCEVRISDRNGKADALGMEFDDEAEDLLIWFEKVE